MSDRLLGRALVTGGAGFLGVHLCQRLLAEGWEVVALDDFSTGSAANLGPLWRDPRFDLREHDVTLPYDEPADWVFNLACPASPPRYQRDGVGTLMTNVLGTYHGLLNAMRHGARFMQASTSEVYGDPGQHPQAEAYRGNTSCTGPRACYDEGKRAAEALVMDFRRQHTLDVRIVRIFNTYGPAMALDDGRVVSNFVTQVLQGQPLTLHGDGTQTRSLCYVDDLIDGVLGAMACEAPGVEEPINLGNPEERTVREIADAVIRCVGRGRVTRLPLPVDDPARRCPDIRRARELFGFAPRVPFEEGLRWTVADFAVRLGLQGPHRDAAVRGRDG